MNLLLILCHRARTLEDWRAVDAAHVHRASLHSLIIETPWLSIVMDDLFLYHTLGLWWANWDEASRGELAVARPHDIFGLDGGRQSGLGNLIKAESSVMLTSLLLGARYDHTLATIFESFVIVRVHLRLSCHVLSTGREWLLLLGQLLDDLSKVTNFRSLDLFLW